MKLSKVAQKLSPSLTLAITAKSKQMKQQGLNIISFGAGEPDFNTPKNIQDAAVEAIRSGKTKYTPASGIIELKKAIFKKFLEDNELNYEENQIIVSTGAKQCLSNIFQAILNPGDEVLIPVPYWVSYPELIKLYYGIPVFVDCNEENSYKYDIKALESKVTANTKAIIINSPNNPTGTIYTYEELVEIAKFAEKHNLFIISDEIYEKLIYGDYKHISIAKVSEDAYHRTIVVNGVSKSYAMTGWRIGYAAGNKELISLMSNIQSHTTSNPTSISQYAALEALNGSQDMLNSMLVEFSARRDLMVEKLSDIKDITFIKPEGAFYVMVNIETFIGKYVDGKVITGSMDFSDALLSKELVAVIPGIAFGLDNYIRLSYAISKENIQEGIQRIKNFVEEIK
ncbi:pyridoxal phosphate-dependent aminotransferase [Clostridium polynesiense]|uniref:pyridoxal phosphate-dependent aminotransferase n=1 Tax=Clostridium polynesiense TaxID=1325933 RepID=UPI00058EB084|nr:pyridoxal phosphate-dependent aminotransferase [Clostridium polynesiense]